VSSAIEWTDETWNPTTGCDRVSPGCDNCYAATMAKRLKAMGQAKYQTDGDPRTSGPGFGLAMHDDVLGQPLRWRKPRRVFVNSMSDLFHPRVTDEFIARVFAVMAATPQHTYQVLTKRPKRMRALLGGPLDSGLASLIEVAHSELEAMTLYEAEWPLPNVWLGTSVEDQQRADERIPALLDTPAAVRFLSCEPLLGPVDLQYHLGVEWLDTLDGWGHEMFSALQGRVGGGLHWIIVGGESGPGARPMHPQWARHLRDQAEAADVAFFFKQTGSVLGRDWGCTGAGHDPDEWPEPFPREFPQEHAHA
jgi:protein gp37